MKSFERWKSRSDYFLAAVQHLSSHQVSLVSRACEAAYMASRRSQASPPSNSPLNDLLDALKPFAEAAQGIEWESTPDHLTFWPVNSLGSDKPISAGYMRQAMEIYKKYRG